MVIFTVGSVVAALATSMPMFVVGRFLQGWGLGAQYAVSLGADNWTLFRRVTLPLILPAFFAGLGVVFIRSMTAISATIFLVSINWTLITVKILENMTEVALGPAAAFSVFVIVVVVFVTGMLNVLLQRLTAPSLRVGRIGA